MTTEYFLMHISLDAYELLVGKHPLDETNPFHLKNFPRKPFSLIDLKTTLLPSDLSEPLRKDFEYDKRVGDPRRRSGQLAQYISPTGKRRKKGR